MHLVPVVFVFFQLMVFYCVWLLQHQPQPIAFGSYFEPGLVDILCLFGWIFELSLFGKQWVFHWTHKVISI